MSCLMKFHAQNFHATSLFVKVFIRISLQFGGFSEATSRKIETNPREHLQGFASKTLIFRSTFFCRLSMKNSNFSKLLRSHSTPYKCFRCAILSKSYNWDSRDNKVLNLLFKTLSVSDSFSAHADLVVSVDYDMTKTNNLRVPVWQFYSSNWMCLAKKKTFLLANC